MKIQRTLCAAFALVSLLATIAAIDLSAQTESYGDVMLVINDRSWASREVGAFFTARRNIPARNVYHINVDSAESMDSATFQTVRWQMQEWMRQNGLADSINYIVTTKGCPLRVYTARWDQIENGQLKGLTGQASFEDCIALMNGEDSTLILKWKLSFPYNRYFLSKQHFKHDRVRMPMYLVTRLDAYTVDQVKSYITRAETPATIGEGLWVLDVDPTKDGNPGYKIGNDWLRTANDTLTSRGMNVVFNSDTTYIHDNREVIGYASWGSNDGYSGGRDSSPPRNTWLNGSLAETFVSTGGRTFNPGSTGGQSVIADWIVEGACGVKGYTDEPYLSAIAHPDILFDRYTAGFNMAESFWAASQFCAWRQVVIGDPKMKLRTMLRLSLAEIDFGSTTRTQMVYDTITVTNNISAALMINAIALGGNDPGDFVVTTPGRSLPSSIPQGGSFDVVIGFLPTTYGARSAMLNIAHRRVGDQRDNMIIAQLSGTALRPTISAPTNYDFGAVAIGDSVEHIIELTNTLPADTLQISSFSKSGGAGSRFTVVAEPVLPLALTGAQTLSMHVTYKPTGSIRDSTTLIVYTVNGGQPARIKLYGTGAVSATRDESSKAARSMRVSPNPMSLRSEVRFELERPATVRVELLDLRGASIRLVSNGPMTSGEQRMTLDISELPAGSYLCRVEITEADGALRTFVTQVVKQ